MSKTVKATDMAVVLEEILDEYGDNINLAMKEMIKKEGKEGAKTLRTTSPKRSGKYQKGWTSTTQTESSAKIQVVIHNKNAYQLAHLLEFGHAKVTRGGRTIGRTDAIPHIKKVEDEVSRRLENEIEEIIRRGV